MAANFRRFSRRVRKGRLNKVSSQDNMLEERKPTTAGINRFQSIDHLNFTGETNSDALPRKIAWAEITNMSDESNKLTEDWMKDWQVELKS